MKFPTGDAYMAAVQNPRTVFEDADLRASVVETTPIGLPKPYSGGFATTFKFSRNSSTWAVRCFKHEIPDLQRRYSAMRRLWANGGNSLFVKSDFLEQGIRVGNSWYPIVKMDWVQGQPLNLFVNDHLSKPSVIKRLADCTVDLTRRLEKLGLAHGDLQHGNIIVQRGEPRLIDYDGMYLPELSGIRVSEIGHVNYQHPQRGASHYNEQLDRFSAIVIYLGLLAASKAPHLWAKYDNSENILFKQGDFAAPDKSALLLDLDSVSDLAIFAERFRGVCRLDFDQVPTLDQFIKGSFTYPKVTPVRAKTPASSSVRSQYPIVEASHKGALKERVGDRIEVVGNITDYHRGRTKYGKPYIFLNFGRYPYQTFTLVIWSEGLDAMSKKGTSAVGLVGKWVSVVGVMSSYQGRPQMYIELPSQIQVLSGETEAKHRLGGRSSRPPVPSSRPTPSPSGKSREADVFNSLYRGRPATPAPRPAKPSYRPTTPSSTASNRNSKSSNCFVATAAFGSFDAPEVQVLRWYRDHILSKYVAGRLFIRLYYQGGPLVAHVVRKNSRMRRISVSILSRMANYIRLHWRLP